MGEIIFLDKHDLNDVNVYPHITVTMSDPFVLKPRNSQFASGPTVEGVLLIWDNLYLPYCT